LHASQAGNRTQRLAQDQLASGATGLRAALDQDIDQEVAKFFVARPRVLAL
jgi:hypothetical protein